ncbi:hypothetical protein NDU88_003570 [Pleurodeles waltl]|uniref:Uncharacterized protein n=1 Tax=Pleurodeles waltl TaxID=8319 RepID=A0AAV7MRJ3_PLEWA|nr:hypothetical protein NDU88_003570 [Pleurodeles waltl]
MTGHPETDGLIEVCGQAQRGMIGTMPKIRQHLVETGGPHDLMHSRLVLRPTATGLICDTYAPGTYYTHGTGLLGVAHRTDSTLATLGAAHLWYRGRREKDVGQDL